MQRARDLIEAYLVDAKLKSYKRINKSKLLKAAQKVYDEWNAEEDGDDDPYGGGGICQDIASEMAGALNDQGYEASAVSAAVGEQHVFVVMQAAEGVINVDIPPSVYERGGGYSWTKLPGVKFKPSDLDIFVVDKDPEKFDDYADDF